MSTVERVTCPQCGSLVPVGDRKCDNCGARQKDFAPAPTSYTRPAAAPAPAPVPAPAPAPAPAREPAPVRDSAPASPPVATPAAFAPTATTSADGDRPLAYPAGSHARGVPARAAAGAAGPGASAVSTSFPPPARSAAASRSLLFALIPLGVNLLGFILLAVVGAVGSGSFADSLLVLGFLFIGFLLLAGLANLVLFVLALVFGIVGVLQTRQSAATGRWRAVLALVIVAWHVLLTIWLIGALAS